MMLSRSRFLLAAAGLALALPLCAQDAPKSGWRAEFIAVMEGTADKYVKLAEAMPDEKYAWRPAAGVRSVGQVYLHIAGANYGLAGRLGAAPPAGVDVRGLENATLTKAEIVKHVRDSFAYFRAAVVAFPEADAEKMVPFFGNPAQITARHFLTFIADHNGEHLGQSIAYARMNGVVPPWSAGGN